MAAMFIVFCVSWDCVKTKNLTSYNSFHLSNSTNACLYIYIRKRISKLLWPAKSSLRRPEDYHTDNNVILNNIIILKNKRELVIITVMVLYY